MVNGQMKAAVWYGPGDLRVEDRPVPAVVPGSLLLKVDSCAVCGSDLRIFREGNPRITAPRTIGHEIAGTVVDVGAGISRFAVGDRVSVGADVPCGQCVHCKNGRPNCCDTNLAIGYQFEGGFAEYIRLDPIVVELGPVQQVIGDIPTDWAALAEPLACCLNGYELALMQPKLSVAVFGAGPIGLMLMVLARQLYQAPRVIAIEPSAVRRQKARQFGADIVIDPAAADPVAAILELTGGAGVDRIFTACPAVQSHEQAIAVVAKRGVVNFFGGLPKSAPPINLLSNHLHYKEAYVMGSHGSTPAHHRRALELIESGRIDVAPFVTHRVALADIAEGFRLAQAGEAIKVIVKPHV